MNTSRYLIFSMANDITLTLVFSSLLLKRATNIMHWLAMIMGILGYLLYDLIVYEGESLTNFSISPQIYNWKSLSFCSMARTFSILTSIYSKRILIQKGYTDRMKERKLKECIIQDRKRKVRKRKEDTKPWPRDLSTFMSTNPTTLL